MCKSEHVRNTMHPYVLHDSFIYKTRLIHTRDTTHSFVQVRALVKHLKPQSCDGTCLEAMGRQMMAVFAMCGMYITNVHPAYHEKLALQLQEDLIREEEEKNQKAQQKKVKAAEKKKKLQGVCVCVCVFVCVYVCACVRVFVCVLEILGYV